MNDELKNAVITRLTKELGETFAANCMLDIVIDSLSAEITKVKEHNSALVASNTESRALIETLRLQAPPRKRA